MCSRGYLLLALMLAYGAAARAGERTAPGVFITDVFSYGDAYRPRIELDGVWEFQRDEDGSGRAQGGHEGKGEFKDNMRIPGVP